MDNGSDKKPELNCKLPSNQVSGASIVTRPCHLKISGSKILLPLLNSRFGVQIFDPGTKICSPKNYFRGAMVLNSK
jgi:hypothetical protein